MNLRFLRDRERTVRKMVAGCKYHLEIRVEKYAISSNNDSANIEATIMKKYAHEKISISIIPSTCPLSPALRNNRRKRHLLL